MRKIKDYYYVLVALASDMQFMALLIGWFLYLTIFVCGFGVLILTSFPYHVVWWTALFVAPLKFIDVKNFWRRYLKVYQSVESERQKQALEEYFELSSIKKTIKERHTQSAEDEEPENT